MSPWFILAASFALAGQPGGAAPGTESPAARTAGTSAEDAAWLKRLEEIDAALAEERARCAEQEADIERLRGALDAVVCRVRDERRAPTTEE